MVTLRVGVNNERDVFPKLTTLKNAKVLILKSEQPAVIIGRDAKLAAVAHHDDNITIEPEPFDDTDVT